MNLLALIGKELLGLFVSDNKLALYALAVVAAAAVCAFGLNADAMVTGSLLALGSGGVLAESVLRAGRG